MVTAAFFDFDKTLLAVDSLETEVYVILSETWEKGEYLRFFYLVVGMALYIPAYEIGIINPLRINMKAYKSYRGIAMTKLESDSQRLYEQTLRPKLYPQILQILKNHRKKGDLIIVISATPEHLLKPFVKEFNIEIWESTYLEIDKKGICTGNHMGQICIGAEKERVLQRLVTEHDIDVETSYAYSDHHHDWEFLDAVGNPKVVNPTKELKKIAKEREWEIITTTH
jgi:HAD superfamily hydrolase (TIGR01490 family)